jgi:hypothetical protein
MGFLQTADFVLSPKADMVQMSWHVGQVPDEAGQAIANSGKKIAGWRYEGLTITRHHGGVRHAH